MISSSFSAILGLSLLILVDASEEEHEKEPHYAILYPWFVQALGVITFYCITRYFGVFPYTALMFLLGTLMGIFYDRFNGSDQLTTSIGMWENINSEVLLIVFLPGLIFYDAYTLNVHLFKLSVWQDLTMAFPMVLAGTVLVALVAFYIFPYGWSFNFCMAFGSILAATDPVAVNALLSEVGAPERLKIHITGESLLNDGSAIVFYTIFSGLFLTELGKEGLGEEYTWGTGIVKFIQMSLGGAGIGVAFGLALVFLLYVLNRKLIAEENVLQVASTITIAYLCFYVAESVLHTSGVLAVVLCGVTTKALGSSLINDVELMTSFWELVEHLLNTLLFAIGGTVWGTIISNVHPREFNATDWGYLFVLYVLLVIIRFALVFSFYPLISRIGLKSSINEAIFMSYGGLRGAVGIALAVSLDDVVFRATGDTGSEYCMMVTKLFGMVGGIAFLTLFINGSTAGALLKKLGLTKKSEVYEKLSATHYDTLKEKLLDGFVQYLSYPLFDNIDFGIVQHYVPDFQNLEFETLKQTVLKNKRGVPIEDYQAPNLDNVLPYLDMLGDEDMTWCEDLKQFRMKGDYTGGLSSIGDSYGASNEKAFLAMQAKHGARPETQQYRLFFLELVRSAYARYVDLGYIGRNAFLHISLDQGLDFAVDAVNQGHALRDWEASNLVDQRYTNALYHFYTILTNPFLRMFPGKKDRHIPGIGERGFMLDVNRAVTFIRGHERARALFQEEWGKDGISGCMECVLQESLHETKTAAKVLQDFDSHKVKVAMSQICSILLLSRESHFIADLSKKGLLPMTEATERLEELDELIANVGSCQSDHEGITNDQTKEKGVDVEGGSLADSRSHYA